MTKKWKIVLLVFFSLVIILITAGALLKRNTKKHSPVDIINFNEGGLTLESVYCRPYRKNRTIFGSVEEGALQPYGEFWRMGANEATTLEANRDITFGGKALKAGKYSIYAVPGEEMWRIVLTQTLIAGVFRLHHMIKTSFLLMYLLPMEMIL